MALFHNRLVRGYAVLLLGLLALITRRLFAPDILDLDISQIAVSFRLIVMNCYAAPGLVNCSDTLIVAATSGLLVVALGWSSLLGFLVAIALTIPPLALYIFLVPIWYVLLAFLLVPPLAYAILDVAMPRLIEAEHRSSAVASDELQPEQE